MLILSQRHTFLVLPMIKIKCLQSKDKTRAVLSTEHRAVIHHCMSLMGHCHLSPCLLPGGTEWSHWLRSNTAFEIRPSLSPPPSLRKHLEEWKILQQNLGAVKQIQKYFSLLVFWLAFRILELVGTFHSLLPDLVSVRNANICWFAAVIRYS